MPKKKIKMVLKPKSAKTAYYTTSNMVWLTCPHCKKIIFAAEKNAMNALKKWKKQKVNKH